VSLVSISSTLFCLFGFVNPSVKLVSFSSFFPALTFCDVFSFIFLQVCPLGPATYRPASFTLTRIHVLLFRFPLGVSWRVPFTTCPFLPPSNFLSHITGLPHARVLPMPLFLVFPYPPWCLDATSRKSCCVRQHTFVFRFSSVSSILVTFCCDQQSSDRLNTFPITAPQLPNPFPDPAMAFMRIP